MRNRYARAKRNLKNKDKSGTSAKALRTAKSKWKSLNSWLEVFIRRRQSKCNVTCSGDEVGEEDDAGESFDAEEEEVRRGIIDELGEEEEEEEEEEEMVKNLMNSTASETHNTNQAGLERPKFGQKTDEDEVEKEEIALLRTFANAVQGKENTEQENEFELFGQYIDKKMKKLNARLDEDAMANVE